jgi:hypothetical protein
VVEGAQREPLAPDAQGGGWVETLEAARQKAPRSTVIPRVKKPYRVSHWAAGRSTPRRVAT